MMVLDTHINVAANKAILFAQYKAYFYLLLYSAVLDGLSTMHFMGRIGPGFESNFFVRHLSYVCGIIIGPILGKALQILAVWLITLFTPKLVKLLCTTIFMLNCYAFVMNMHI